MIRFLMFIFRFLLGAVFIVSGVTKFVDPVGFALKISDLLHYPFLQTLSPAASIVLSTAEIVLGLAIWMRVHIRIVSIVTMVMMVLYTGFALYMAIGEPVSDCGCFGEAIYLTPWETFWKNVILLLMSICIFLYRKRFRTVSTPRWEMRVIIIFSVLALIFCTSIYLTAPAIDFGPYSVGSNLMVQLEDARDANEFETVFTYSKDGESREFTLDNLPDESWTFEESHTVNAHKRTLFEKPPFQMRVTDRMDNDITEELLMLKYPLIMSVVRNPQGLAESAWREIAMVRDSVVACGGYFMILLPSMDEQVDSSLNAYGLSSVELGFSDYRTLIAMMRSNGGFLYLNEGIVVAKVASGFVEPRDTRAFINGSADEEIVYRNIRRGVGLQAAILIVLFLFVMFKYISSFFQKGRAGMLLIPIALSLVSFASCGRTPDEEEPRVEAYLASDSPDVATYAIDAKEKSLRVCDTLLLRGSKVLVFPERECKLNKKDYAWVETDEFKGYVDKTSVVEDYHSTVLEKKVFVRTSTVMTAAGGDHRVAGFAGKGSSLLVAGFDTLDAKGRVVTYTIEMKDKNFPTAVIAGRYTCQDSLASLQNYRAEHYDTLHSAAKDKFGGGRADGCDYYPVEKPQFEGRRMPQSCYGLYLNCTKVGRIDEYIEFAKKTKINTFVIDIKDNTAPGFKAQAMKTYSPTSYRKAPDNARFYREAVRKLHEAGFWVVGRITCFKDSYFVEDNPQCALMDKRDGKAFFHNKSYWPSAYSRRVWEYNVALAKEIVREFGFDEINFDYVRFPDKVTSIEEFIDYRNIYGESKVQAVQCFVRYACDQLHGEGVYVSIDVFGESANGGYTTGYGQYWPAISNVCDVICGMPYPDHFADNYYGVKKPWNHPYEIMYQWGLRVQAGQKKCPTPAKVRTWVQAYHVMKHVDSNGIDYDAENLEKEIRGLYEAGLVDGYVPWLSNSKLDKYEEQLNAYNIDYYKEYCK